MDSTAAVANAVQPSTPYFQVEGLGTYYLAYSSNGTVGAVVFDQTQGYAVTGNKPLAEAATIKYTDNTHTILTLTNKITASGNTGVTEDATHAPVPAKCAYIALTAAEVTSIKAINNGGGQGNLYLQAENGPGTYGVTTHSAAVYSVAYVIQNQNFFGSTPSLSLSGSNYDTVSVSWNNYTTNNGFNDSNHYYQVLKGQHLYLGTKDLGQMSGSGQTFSTTTATGWAPADVPQYSQNLYYKVGAPANGFISDKIDYSGISDYTELFLIEKPVLTALKGATDQTADYVMIGAPGAYTTSTLPVWNNNVGFYRTSSHTWEGYTSKYTSATETSGTMANRTKNSVYLGSFNTPTTTDYGAWYVYYNGQYIQAGNLTW
jgi:hypothetical protein